MAKPRRQPQTAPVPPQKEVVPPARLHPVLLAVALGLLVIGARWYVIGNYGTDVPWMDQWDAEAQGLYVPSQAGTLSLHDWFAPHNEHRIFFTRALALGLFWGNGQWDPRLEAVANAAKHGQARNVGIALETDGAGWRLVVRDDGRGFVNGAGNSAGMGIRIMHYRARVIGATLNLQSSPGSGTHVTCVSQPPDAESRLARDPARQSH